MKVLVYEPKFVGHFLGFAAATARAFADQGHEVTLLLSRHAEGSQPAVVKLGDGMTGIKVRYECDVPAVYKKWTNARIEADALTRVLDDSRTDWLVVPSADFLLKGLMLRGGLRRRLRRLDGVDLVLHNLRQVYPQPAMRELPGLWLDRLAVSLAGSFRLHSVDEYATSGEASGRMALSGNPVKPLPHFFDPPSVHAERGAARESLGLDPEAWWIGSVGDLGRRKGTELLIESFALSEPSEKRRLALFGLMSDSVRATLHRHRGLVDRGLIHVCDRFITDGEFHRFFPAMDTVWVGYPRHVGIASTLLFAADAGRPVIAIDYGGVGWTVRKYGLGTVCRNDREAIASTIASGARSPQTVPHLEGAEQLLERHTTRKFSLAITAGARAARPTAPAVHRAYHTV